MITEEKLLEVLKQIIEIRDYEKGSRLITSNFDSGTELKQGQFLYALHPYASAMQCVGFAVQVRKKIGLFGSDLVLIRLANGSLQAWENQGFFTMHEEQEKLAREVFKVLPENEDYSTGYWYCKKDHEIGFIIESPKPVATAPVQQVSMTIKEDDTVTHISFI